MYFSLTLYLSQTHTTQPNSPQVVFQFGSLNMSLLYDNKNIYSRTACFTKSCVNEQAKQFYPLNLTRHKFSMFLLLTRTNKHERYFNLNFLRDKFRFNSFSRKSSSYALVHWQIVAFSLQLRSALSNPFATHHMWRMALFLNSSKFGCYLEKMEKFQSN